MPTNDSAPTETETEASSAPRRPTLDIVVPAFNEAESLPLLHRRLSDVLGPLDYDARMVIVDDGSSDETREVCRELSAGDPRFVSLHLSRNFGHQNALTAGLDYADADVVITLDADLQHPPEVIPAFLREWENGAQVVHGVRDSADGFLKRRTSWAFYRVMNLISEVPLVADAPDFRLLDRAVVDAVCQMREQTRFFRGLFAFVGFREARVQYNQASREQGESKYTLWKMFSLGMSAIFGFTRVPLKLTIWIGLLISTCAFGYGGYALAQRLFFDHAVPGWASLAILVSLLSGVQMIFLGVIGQYLGQVLQEVRARPLYVLDGAPRPRRSEADRG